MWTAQCGNLSLFAGVKSGYAWLQADDHVDHETPGMFTIWGHAVFEVPNMRACSKHLSTQYSCCNSRTHGVTARRVVGAAAAAAAAAAATTARGREQG